MTKKEIAIFSGYIAFGLIALFIALTFSGCNGWEIAGWEMS